MSMAAGGKGVKSDINVTPLVDVCLVLLIIFMVITPMLQRGKNVKLPEAHKANLEGETQGGDPVLLALTKDGKVFLDKKEIPRDQIKDLVAPELVGGHPLVFKGDKDVTYKDVRPLILEVSKIPGIPGMRLAATAIKENQ